MYTIKVDDKYFNFNIDFTDDGDVIFELEDAAYVSWEAIEDVQRIIKGISRQHPAAMAVEVEIPNQHGIPLHNTVVCRTPLS